MVGISVALASIAIFFWWGFAFDTWGRRFSPDPAFLGFVSWFVLGTFGAGYVAGGVRTGLRWGGLVLALLAAALGFGVLSGNYR
jgi:hypothetical protein